MASIGSPFGVATDGVGNLYFASLNCVFKLDQNGVMTRVAGNSRAGYSGDGGPAISAQLNNGPGGIAADGVGNIYVADLYNNRIRKVSPAGIITTFAGGGTGGDGKLAASAILSLPRGVVVDPAGNVYLSSLDRVQKVTPDGIITTVAGGGASSPGDGGPATGAALSPAGIALDGAGDIFIGDTTSALVRKVSPEGIITTVAGNTRALSGYSGDGGLATNAQLQGPFGIAVDADGNLYIADLDNFRIRAVSPGGIITTLVGNGTNGYSGDGGPALGAQLGFPAGVALDRSGRLYIADSGNSRIRQVSPAGIISTVAGNGIYAYSGDGGQAARAQLIDPGGVAVDSNGNVYVADARNSRVRKVSPGGNITTVAGNGTNGYSGDGGPAINAGFSAPQGIAVDGSGNLYIADYYGYRVRKVSAGGIVSTVAGGGSAFPGDGGLATSAFLGNVYGIAVDNGGNIYFSLPASGRVRKVSPAGIITTLPVSGVRRPQGISLDNAGNLYIADADAYSNQILKFSPDGATTPVAGGGFFTRDGIPAVQAELNSPQSVAVDGAGSLYIAQMNSLIRKVSPDGIIHTIAGQGTGYAGDGGPAAGAQLGDPVGVAVDGGGNVYVADGGNGVRLLTLTNQSVLIGAVLDAASESVVPISPGKIVVIYGAGMGPSALVQNQPSNGAFGTQLSGTSVSFNGIPAPIVYTSATQVAVIAPYEISNDQLFSTSAQITVSYQGQISAAFTVQVAASAPSFFTSNQTGAGQAAVLDPDGTPNDAAHPAAIGSYIAMFATGEGQTSPASGDGQLATTQPYPAPVLPVKVFVGGIPAQVVYAATAPTEVAGLFQVNIQIPAGVQPGGYVPIVLQVGSNSTVNGAVWIAVSAH
jgi:trimeric autotransporter adhesin